MYEPYATMGDAHREWHRNTGNLIGYTACPMDACDPGEIEWDDETVAKVRAYREAFEAAADEYDERECEHGLSLVQCYGPDHYC